MSTDLPASQDRNTLGERHKEVFKIHAPLDQHCGPSYCGTGTEDTAIFSLEEDSAWGFAQFGNIADGEDGISWSCGREYDGEELGRYFLLLFATYMWLIMLM